MWYEIARRVPWDDTLRSIGLMRASQASNGAQTFGAFALGVLVGAGLGMLFAPAPGAELRERMRREMERQQESMQGESMQSH